jgi:hypothetical protein
MYKLIAAAGDGHTPYFENTPFRFAPGVLAHGEFSGEPRNREDSGEVHPFD